MTSARPSRPRYRTLWVLLASVALSSCGGDDDSDGVGPDPGPEPPATVNVSVSTTGEELPASYSLTVTSSDGSLQDTGTILVNGSRSFNDVPAGVTVQALLGGLPANCTLSGQNPQTVATQSGQQATLSFQVTCVAVVGAVQVLTVTTGTELDVDGYTVTVAGTAEAIGVNDSETFSGLPVGDYPVELSNVDASCSLSGENPRTISVAFEQTSQTTFQITCPVLLEVQTQTTGQALDPDGYSLVVDQAAAGAIATNGTSSFGLLPGAHSVELTGVATNCSVAGDNPRNVTLQTSAGANVLFEIACEANQGSITVQTTTLGWDVPAAYGLSVDLQDQGNIGANAQVEIPGFASGARSVQLTGVPANCSVQEANPQLVNVVVGQTVQADFTLACGGIAFESDRNGIPRTDIFVANSDGSAPPTQISGFLPTNLAPSWHPHRSMIAYAGQPGVSLEICTQRVDQPGAPPTFLMTDNFGDTDPAWSPDGTKIAFRSDRDGDREIYVMNADGTGLLQLTNNVADDQDPSWSPDGQQIVFHSNRAGDRELFIMNADGSSGENPFQLTSNATNEEDPAWSPDGTTIAFVSDRHGAREVFLLAADGSSGQNWVRLTTNAADEENPAWSPDGLRIAFTSDRDGDDEIYIMMADGSSGENPFQLTNNTAKDDEAGWRE